MPNISFIVAKNVILWRHNGARRRAHGNTRTDTLFLESVPELLVYWSKIHIYVLCIYLVE